MDQLLPVMLFVLAPFVGSFMALFIQRWPMGEPWASGRSKCDVCGRGLSWGEVIPLVSFAIQRGRSRCCGQPLTLKPLFVELAALMGPLLAIWFFPGPGERVCFTLLVWICLPLMLIDWRHRLLPDICVAALAFLGLVGGPVLMQVHPLDGAIGALLGGGGLWFIRICYQHLRGREGLGFGDVKLMAAIGFWGGWQSMPIILILAAVGAIGDILVRSWLARQGPNALDDAALGAWLCLALLLWVLTSRLFI